MMKTEILERADFSKVRYGQCWEDADILVKALKVHEGRRCLSIGSAGDNSFALLAAGASHVTAVEINPAQIQCIELRRRAYLELNYEDFLRTVMTSRGKFENYFETFRTKVLPLAHSKEKVQRLLESKPRAERIAFYEEEWNTWRWRGLFKVFFSRFVMGRLGRDPAFFDYVEGSVAEQILKRTEYALTELDPAKNPYLEWILTGRYGRELPYALQRESYEKIREALRDGRFEVKELSVEEAVMRGGYEAYNLSDIFEYMSEEATQELLHGIAMKSEAGARLAYWNMLAPRSAKTDLLVSCGDEAEGLFLEDRAFFYANFMVEEVR